VTKPFRWDITRREQLGRLLSGESAESYPQFLDDLRVCCARVLAMAGDSRLVFVGRSPESLFDYSSGALADTSWADRLVHLNLSLREADDVLPVEAREAVRAQLASLQLDARSIAIDKRSIAFIDLIYTGTTLGALVQLLTDDAEAAGVGVDLVRRRLRIVGITERTKNSPNTWRWQQRCEWASDFPSRVLKGVSVPWRFWSYLGNTQAKVSRSNPPSRWLDPEMGTPPRDPEHTAALRLARALYEHGRTREEREALARVLSTQREIRGSWLRRLVLELRR
jgi:hypothetical protein